MRASGQTMTARQHRQVTAALATELEFNLPGGRVVRGESESEGEGEGEGYGEHKVRARV